jgi:hypothetical protein
LDKAYQFISRSILEFKKLSSSDKQRVQKKGVNLPALQKFQQNITRSALLRYQEQNTVEALTHFTEHYTTASQKQLEQAFQQRNQLLLEEAERLNSFEQYKMIWERYKKNMLRYNTKSVKLVERRLLESYIAEKGWAMYPRFEELYPENIYVLDDIAAYDYLQIQRSNDLKDYQNFIDAYPRSPFVKFAKDRLLMLILEGNSLPDYDAFVRAYPNHPEVDPLWKRFYELYTHDQQLNTYYNFAASYPTFPFPEILQADLEQAQLHLETPLYEQLTQTEDIVEIMNFVTRFPASSYISSLEATFYNALEKRPIFRGAQYFIKRYPNSSYYDAVLELYYKEYIKDGELGTLNQFMMEHPEYKDLAQQERDLKIAEQGALLDVSKMPTEENRAAYEAYILAAAPKERAFVALQRLLEPAIRQRKWDKAQQILARFETAFGKEHTNFQQLRLLLKAPVYRSAELPAVINSPQADRVVGITGTDLQFARAGQLYQSSYQNQTWTTPIALPVLNEGLAGDYWAFSPNQKELVFSKEGDLYYRLWREGQWSEAMKFPEDINRPDRELDVQWSADGSALLYSSESDQVLDWKTAVVSKNFHGSERSNSDLFVILRDENGYWQKTINLGDQINTPFAERYPFLHPDGKTLYFSSEGHGGVGGLDLYYSRRLDDTWTRWSLPINVGTSVNTPDDEGPCAVGRSYQTLYFTRESEAGNLIFRSPVLDVK